MITLSIRNNITRPHIVVVACLHGNETLGFDVYKEIAADPARFDNLTIIVANTAAYREKTRFIDTDLNRAFPGDSAGNHEEQLASRITKIIAGAAYVIDIHTTTSPGFTEAAITGPMSSRHKRIIQAAGVPQIAIMEEKLLASSLIGTAEYGVSIEYGEDFVVAGRVTQRIMEAIIALQDDASLKPLAAKVYDVRGMIKRAGNEEVELKNFTYNEELGGYPFIADEVNYTTYRGFLLGSVEDVVLDIVPS